MLNEISYKNAQKRRNALLSVISSMRAKPGWIKYTRTLMKMTLKDLAFRAGLALPTIAQPKQSDEKHRARSLLKH